MTGPRQIQTTLRDGQPVVILVPAELASDPGVLRLMRAKGDRGLIGAGVAALGRHGLQLRLVDALDVVTFVISRREQKEAP